MHIVPVFIVIESLKSSAVVSMLVSNNKGTEFALPLTVDEVIAHACSTDISYRDDWQMRTILWILT